MRRALVNILTWSAACVAMAPFIWMACAAFKQGEDLFTYAFLPWGHLERLTWDNFRALFGGHPFGAWMLNSLLLASAQTVLVTVLSSLGGFALAKYRFAGKRWFYLLMLATVLVPSQVMLGGLYELMDGFGWIDTYRAVILPGSVSVFGLILFRQALSNVPDELLDAARIDGCAEWRLWWSIAMPLVRPMTSTFALLGFLASWNAYLWPQIILQTESRFTLPLGMANLLSTPGARVEYGILMAGTFVSVVPVILLFGLMQRELVGGLGQGAGK